MTRSVYTICNGVLSHSYQPYQFAVLTSPHRRWNSTPARRARESGTRYCFSNQRVIISAAEGTVPPTPTLKQRAPSSKQGSSSCSSKQKREGSHSSLSPLTLSESFDSFSLELPGFCSSANILLMPGLGTVTSMHLHGDVYFSVDVRVLFRCNDVYVLGWLALN
jgi:hypothetical protein